MEKVTRDPRCPRCGARLDLDSLDGLCPACLLALAAGETELQQALAGDESTIWGTFDGSPAPVGNGRRPSPGQLFGPYRIERLLGRGGMGEVYEAEHLEQGRRVAIKVLNQQLADQKDRTRFLREGQLAASLNHPNSVYIFGSEEIGGSPVISMELLPGGTLKDRVKATGPLPPAEAVDAILQVIAGLDAASVLGILHRDIKPANCFTDLDGRVKIGDFGLSISTLARDVSQITTGGFQGTPQFAAPEQIRGEPLDVRADIYAVGATLYYLLTGQAPFDDQNLMTLLAKIATEAPRSPRELQPRVPRGLAAIVLRCLAKDRTNRIQTYSELDELLRPFGSEAPTPATLGRRLIAGLIDSSLLQLVFFPPLVLSPDTPTSRMWQTIAYSVTTIFYFVILEGVWGASLGKSLCRLRVQGPDGQRLGGLRATMRVLVWMLPDLLQYVPMALLGPARFFRAEDDFGWMEAGLLVTSVFIQALMYSTARRRNGFAGVHELATQTRVVEWRRRDFRAVLNMALEPAPKDRTHGSRIGPYDVAGTLGPTEQGELLDGFDPSLRRKVWIHVLARGAAAVPQHLRDLGRPGRLRWLSGRRSETENWDAYEALDGVPFVRAIDEPQPWPRVKRWLLDLAQEIVAGLESDSLPVLSLDRVWITRDAGAKVLDFRVPGAAATSTPNTPTFESAQAFLAAFARGALTVHQPPPLSASRFLSDLGRSALKSPQELRARTDSLRHAADHVARGARAGNLVIASLPIVMVGAVVIAMKPSPETMKLVESLSELQAQEISTLVQTPPEREQQEALEVYVAGRFKAMIADPMTWGWQDLNRPGLQELERPTAARVVAAHPNVSNDDVAAASVKLGTLLARYEEYAKAIATTRSPANLNLLDLYVRQLRVQEEARRPKALAVYIAGRFGPLIAEGRTWSDPVSGPPLAPWRIIAERVLSAHPRVSDEELAAASDELAPFFEREKAQWVRHLGTLPEDLALLRRYLRQLQTDETEAAVRTRLDPARRQALEIYIAGRFGSLISSEQVWTIAPRMPNFQTGRTPEGPSSIQRQLRLTARRVLAAHPQVSSEDLAAAGASLKPFIDKYEEFAGYPPEANYPRDFHVLNLCVRQLLVQEEGFVRNLLQDPTPRKAALELYIAGHFASMIARDRTWTDQVIGSAITPLRPVARRVLASHSQVSSEKMAEAALEVEPFLAERVSSNLTSRRDSPWFLTLGVLMILGLISAFVARGGAMMRTMGIAVVTGSGAEASRLRALLRAAIAWSPVMALCMMWFGPARVILGFVAPDLAVLLPCFVFAAGAALAVWIPERGLQDRLAGTWLVPR